MSETGTSEDRPLDDAELGAAAGARNAVEHVAIGGAKANGWGSWLDAVARAMGQAMNARL